MHPGGVETELKHTSLIKKLLGTCDMNLAESLRVAILDNPIQAPENSTSSSLFLYNILYNSKFDAFLLGMFILLAILTIILVIRPRRASRDVTVYITCALVILSALELSYISKIMGTDATLHNVEVTQHVKMAVDNSKAYLFKMFDLFSQPNYLWKPYLTGTLEDKPPAILISRIQDLLSRKEGNNNGNDSQISLGKDVVPALGDRQHLNITQSKEQKNKGTKDSVVVRASGAARQESKRPRANVTNAKVSKMTAEDVVGKKVLTEKEKDSTAIDTNTSVEPKGNGHHFFISVASTDRTDTDNDDEEYMNSILNIFNLEFNRNNKTAAYFNDLDKIKGPVSDDLQTFNVNFQEFYVSAMKIEKKLSSFNANPRYFQYEASDLTANAKETMAVLQVLDSLNYKDGTDAGLNSVFKVNNHSKNAQLERLNVIKSAFCLTVIRCCLFITLIIGLALIYMLVTETGPANIFIITAGIALALNVLFGIYLMLLAQSFDRVCQIGNVDGCKKTYSDSFAKFAATANLDLNRKDKAYKIETIIDRLEERTQRVVDVLKVYLHDQPEQKFRYRSSIIQGLIDKINFVKEDFEKLNCPQVDLKQFYDNIDTMNQALYRMRVNLDNIQNDKILDVYTQEVIFLNFIKSEKRRISQHIYDQVAKAELSLKGSAGRPCVLKKIYACLLKNQSDRLYFAVIIVSTCLLALYAV